MKKTITSVFIALLLVISFSSVLHAQTDTVDPACSTVTNDNYDHCCSGVAANDSPACNTFMANDSGTATDAQCSNINSYVLYTDCCSGAPANDSPACNTYNTDNGGTPAKTLNPSNSLTGSLGNVLQNGGLPGTNTATPTPANQALNIHLQNPLAVNTITDAINLIMSVVIRIALPLIIVFFIWSGLTFIFARGNPEKIEVAKNMFFYTVIGTLLILGAWVITNAIIGTVNAIIN